MIVLVINTGSSSIKYKLFSMDRPAVLCYGILEKIGESESVLTHHRPNDKGKPYGYRTAVSDHTAGMQRIVDLLTDPEKGVIDDVTAVTAVGHRVVHGAESFRQPTIIDQTVIDAIGACIPLAPLHNPANIIGIEVAQRIFPSAMQVAVFDTAFHHTIPPAAHLYALPFDLYTRLKIRRYGFHGTSHHFVADAAAAMIGQALPATNLITIHLGNGGSITAIENGRSVDTSMGMTPLEGLIMGTRCGDIDPAIPGFLTQNTDLTAEAVDDLLNKQSGLKGICGRNDMREILSAATDGDERARTALDMYVYRIRKYIGAYTAVLKRIDAVAFTAGIGEHAAEIRHRVCTGLEHLGLKLDPARNRLKSCQPREIQTADSPVRILVIPTDEELMIARETMQLVKQNQINQ
jgi:acetate kinase